MINNNLEKAFLADVISGSKKMGIIKEIVSNWKVELVALIAIVYALSAFLTGHMTSQMAFQYILIALGGTALKNELLP